MLADQRVLPVNLSPLGRIEQFDDQLAIASAARADPHSQVIGRGTLSERRDTQQLTEAAAFSPCSLNQFMEVA